MPGQIIELNLPDGRSRGYVAQPGPGSGPGLLLLGDSPALDPLRFGVEACRPTLEIIIDYCVRQKLLPRKIAVDALFDDTTRALAP